MNATAYIPALWDGDDIGLSVEIALKLYKLTQEKYEVAVKRHPRLVNGESLLVLDGGTLEPCPTK